MENQEETGLQVKSVNEITKKAKSDVEVFTNITDSKTIFNLESNCDYKLNDCKGQKIKVKGVELKRIVKNLEKPIINEETGEIVKDKETKLITILVDSEGKSYVTASMSFGIQLSNYLSMFGTKDIDSENGLMLEICEKQVKNSNNKALSFKLV